MRAWTKADREMFFRTGSSPAVRRGEIRCVTCETPAVAATHRGNADSGIAECAVCFKARVQRERDTRPSRAALVARVNAAIASA